MFPQPFSAELLQDVAHFDCGDDRWGLLASAWISGTENADDSALRSIRNYPGTRVWLYRLENARNARIIGFGSLGPNRWQIDGQWSNILYIPQLGLHRDFQRKPTDVPFAERYSWRLMDHLLHSAQMARNNERFVALKVHSDNSRARQLYRRIGFLDTKSPPGEYMRMIWPFQ